MISKFQIRIALFSVLCLLTIWFSWELLQAQESPVVPDIQAVTAWSPPGTDLSSGSLNGSLSKISVSPTTNEVVAVFGGWTGSDSSKRDPYFARSTDSGANWSAASVIEADTNSSTLVNLTHDQDGNTHAVWLSLNSSGATAVYTVRHAMKPANSASFNASKTINSITSNLPGAVAGVSVPTIIESSNGVLDVIWDQIITANTTSLTLWHSRSLDDGATWSSPTTVIASPTVSSYSPSLTADAAGGLHLVWEHKTANSTTNIYYAKYSGSSWSSPISISTNALVSNDSYRPSIEFSSNQVHVAFIESASNFSPQITYYRTCATSSNTCTSESHWTDLINISSQIFDVNTAPVNILPILEYDTAANTMHVFFYGIRDGSSSTNEVLWHNASCNNWADLQSITEDSVQTIYPQVAAKNGTLHLSYDDYTNDQIYYMSDTYTCGPDGRISYLPLILR